MRKLIAVLVTAVAVLALTAPADAARTTHFEGTYSGENFFEFFTERCPFMDDVFDNVLTTDRGPGGTMHAEACATITNGTYRAAGTFTIRLPGGTFSGTYTSEATLPAPLPSSVIPHQVTSGTGRFRGATGTCGLILESLIALEFGHQLEAGTWSCDLRWSRGQ